MHCAWAARKLAFLRPTRHVDISSHINWVTAVSAFVPMEFYEYRKFDVKLDNLTCGHADLMALPFVSGSIRSLSCMHTLEHIGLGRYGDRLDPKGDIKGAAELSRVLATGGDLLFVTPVSCDSVLFFNGARQYTYRQVLDLFPELRLNEFSFISPWSKGEMILNSDPDVKFSGTGCFWFQK
jgi:hypothetical protein